jgi:rhodanese-related sulfurtransferase
MMKKITADKLNKEKESYIILDIREHTERVNDGYIPYAKHIPGTQVNLENLQEFLNLTDGKPIVIHCRSGARSLNLQKQIIKNKLYPEDKVYNLEGGFMIWKASGFETL